MSLARRNLLRDKTRLSLSVAGVALAIMLILFLGGFRTGVYRQAAAYLDHVPGSVVVAQAGVSDFAGSTSLLPPGTVAAARRVPGVARVVPILSQVAILDLHGVKESAYVIGYAPESGGGPWQLSAGREPRAAAEVVVDRVLAQQHDLPVGARPTLMGRTFRVVGLSDGTRLWAGSYLFVRQSALATLLRAPGATGLLFVTPAAGLTPETLRQRLQSVPGTSALLKSTLIANDIALLARIYDAPLLLMVGIAFLVGVLVVGLVIYAATVERQREYGVLKAIGASSGVLYRVVTIQALIAASVGAVLGGGLALGAASLVMALRPQILLVIEPAALAGAFGVGLAMALLAALLPARAVTRLAPAEVFRR